MESIDADGRIIGKVTYHGVTCKAWNDPILNGTWRDGVDDSVNGGHACGKMHFSMKQGTTRFLEGTGFGDFNPALVVTNWLEAERRER